MLSADIEEGVFEFEMRGFFDDEDVSTWLTGPNQQDDGDRRLHHRQPGRVEFRSGCCAISSPAAGRSPSRPAQQP